VSGSAERLEALERRVRRILALLSDPEGVEGSVSFLLQGSAVPPDVDVVFEATAESLEAKRQAWNAAAAAVSGGALRLTNSSSILPSAINGLTAGLHVFHPVELTGFAEIVVPDRCSAEKRDLVLALADRWGLTCAIQTEQNAFALNRLLLPLQVEVLRALMAGLPPVLVDGCSCSDMLPQGQLAMMDGVGLDVLHAAASNYVCRMPGEAAAEYAPLLDGIASLLAMGKRGRKNNDGLLRGRPLPWDQGDVEPGLEERLRITFESLFLNTCLRFLDHGLLDAVTLERAMKAVFQSGCSLPEAVGRPGAGELRRNLEALHRETGLDYFCPARSLVLGTCDFGRNEAAGR